MSELDEILAQQREGLARGVEPTAAPVPEEDDESLDSILARQRQGLAAQTGMPSPTPEGDDNFITRGLDSLVSGLDSLAHSEPVQATGAAAAGFQQGMLNPLGGLVDLTAAGINKGVAALGGPEDLIKDPFLGSEDLNLDEVYGDFGYPTVHRMGELTGEGASIMAGGAAATAGRTATTATGHAINNMFQMARTHPVAALSGEAIAGAGAGAGGALTAHAFGPEYRNVGEFFGGFGPAALAGGGISAVHHGLKRKPTEHMSRLADLHITSGDIHRAAKDIGLDASASLVGSPGMHKLHNAATMIPIGGEGALRANRRETAAVADAVTKAADDIRTALGSDPGTIRISEEDIGENIHQTARKGLARLLRQIRSREGNLSQSIGKDTATDAKSIQRELAQLKQNNTGELADALDSEIASLERIRTTPIDKNLHDQLLQKQTRTRSELARAEKRLSAAQKQFNTLQGKRLNNPQAQRQLDNLSSNAQQQQQIIASLKDDLDMVAGEIDDNIGVGYTALRRWRSQIGKRLDNMTGVGTDDQGDVYDITSESLKGLASDTGNLDEWTSLQKLESNALGKKYKYRPSEGGDRPFLDNLAKKEGRPVFNAVVASGKIDSGKLDALKRNSTAEEWSEIAADIIEWSTRSVGSQQDASGAATSAETFLTTWSTRFSPRTKELLVEDRATRHALDQAAIVAQAIRDRGKSANPGRITQAVVALGAMAGMATAPVATLMSIGGTIGAVEVLTSKMLTNTLAGQYPGFQQRIINRLAGQGARMMSDGPKPPTEESPGPLEVPIYPGPPIRDPQDAMP